MLSFAARHADIVSINVNLREGTGGPETAPDASPERTREKVAWVKEAAGDRFDELELNALIGFVDDHRRCRRHGRAMAPHFGIAAEDALHIPLALLGTLDEMARSWSGDARSTASPTGRSSPTSWEDWRRWCPKLSGT